MKILVICYEHPPVGGGGGRVAAQVAQGLVKRGHEVVYLTVNVGRWGRYAFAREEVVGGVRVVRVGTHRRSADTCSVLEMFWYVVQSLVPAVGWVRRWQPDVVHGHFAVPSGAVAFVGAMANAVPYCLTVHLGDVPGGVPEQTEKLFRVLKPLTVPIWRGAARVSAVSRHVAGLAERAYGIRPEVILNGVDMVPMGEKELTAETGRLLWVGRMSVQKNPLMAIEVLRFLRDGDWELEMVGDGPLRGEAERRRDELGLQGRVRFHGWLEQGEVRRLQRECAILLMTSLHEGLPMVAVEGLMAGMAIVSTDIPGVGDVVEDGVNGRRVAADAQRIAEVIEELGREPERLRNFRQKSLRMAENFRLDRIVEEYEKFLEKAKHRQGGQK